MQCSLGVCLIRNNLLSKGKKGYTPLSEKENYI